MIWVAFDPRNKKNYHDLFNLMLTQMAVKQISANLIEYLQPLLLSRKKLIALEEEYEGLLKQYGEPERVEGQET